MRNFKNLRIWNEAMELVKVVYELSAQVPNTEKFGLVSQMCRAAVSIPSNIAEGCGRNTDKEFKRFLEIAIGSAFELETQITLCKDLSFIDEKSFTEVISGLHQLQKQINNLITKLKAKS